MLKLKKNDKIIITKGKDKKKIGLIKKTIIINNKVYYIIEGLNLYNKNIKANPNKNIEGGIIKIEKKINAANIRIINNQESKDKISFKLNEKNKKVRMLKKSKEFLN